MRRDVATLLAASALYGFSIGCVHSTRFGLHNLIKFPLLFLITGIACAVAYHLWALLVGGARFHPWPLSRRLITVGGWLALSLLVGGQAAWTLRPFFGVRSIPGEKTRFFLGSAPDYRGSTNFYEAVRDVVTEPRLAPDYIQRGTGYDAAPSN